MKLRPLLLLCKNMSYKTVIPNYFLDHIYSTFPLHKEKEVLQMKNSQGVHY